MPFNHKPVAEEDVLLKDGTYDGVVKSAVTKKSSKGNNMMELLIEFYGPGRRKQGVFDYLVDMESMAWKTRHFCESAGLDYDAGELDEHEVVGKNIRADLTIEKQAGYKPKNKVVDYLPRDGKPIEHQEEFQATDADVPF